LGVAVTGQVVIFAQERKDEILAFSERIASPESAYRKKVLSCEKFC